MQFADLALSRRLERAEGYACVQYAEARRRLFPDSGAEWMECAGTYAAFDGVESPLTQTFGLGLFEELSATTLDVIEKFFFDRGAPVLHEVSPFAGVAALEMLCDRNYRPIEVSNVLRRTVERPEAEKQSDVSVRLISADEAQVWSRTSARGWSDEHPEFHDFILDLGTIISAGEHSLCFLAEQDGKPGAAGVMCIHEGVALFGGAATVPEMRRRGMQALLLRERMRYASEHGCDVAMMVTQPGSNSQRNAERNGFQIAYTRTKWQLRTA
jgi:hypothetical protein